MLKEYNQYLEYKNNKLYLEGVSLEFLAKKFNTPLYVYSSSYIKDKIKEYKNVFPEALICYAIKANFNPGIIKIIKKEGLGADIVSGGELHASLLAGIEPQRIVYAGVGKTEKEIIEAIRADILMFNVESRMELDVMNKLAKKLNKKVRIAIRVNPDVNPKTHPYIATGMKKSKFGVDIKEAIKEYEYASKLKNLEIVGIHCHIGSQILDISPYRECVEKIYNFYNSLIKKGFNIKYIDMGGGLGIKYKPSEKDLKPDDLANVILPLLKNLPIKLILEPGRSIVGNAGILVARVEFIKNKSYKNFIIVDAGMNDLIRPALYGSYHHIISVKKNNKGYIKADIVGPVCETGDFLALDRKIQKLARGDYLAVLSSGAYGFAMSSRYNLRAKPCEILVENGNYKLMTFFDAL